MGAFAARRARKRSRRSRPRRGYRRGLRVALRAGLRRQDRAPDRAGRRGADAGARCGRALVPADRRGRCQRRDPAPRAVGPGGGRGRAAPDRHGLLVGGYCSDSTRTLAVGEVGDAEREVYELVWAPSRRGSTRCRRRHGKGRGRRLTRADRRRRARGRLRARARPRSRDRGPRGAPPRQGLRGHAGRRRRGQRRAGVYLPGGSACGSRTWSSSRTAATATSTRSRRTCGSSAKPKGGLAPLGVTRARARFRS